MANAVPPELPAFLSDYLDTLTASTRNGYCIDLRLFFAFLKDHREALAGIEPSAIPFSVLPSVSAGEISSFLDSLSATKTARGRARKLSSIRSMYRYYVRSGLLRTDPSREVPLPKIPEREVTHLKDTRVQELLQKADEGDGLTRSQQYFHDKTGSRDLAILSLLVGTGIRTRECAALNLADVDLEHKTLRVERKTGTVLLSLDRRSIEALTAYLPDRNRLPALPGSENALFLSLQNRRICVRAIEKLVRKYGELTGGSLTPRDLRATFGVNLLTSSGDPKKVTAALGHGDGHTARRNAAVIKRTLSGEKGEGVPRAFVRKKILPETDDTAP